MTVMVRADREGDIVRLVLAGCVDLPHAAEVAEAIVAPRSVDWRSVPALVQAIGADGVRAVTTGIPTAGGEHR